MDTHTHTQHALARPHPEVPSTHIGRLFALVRPDDVNVGDGRIGVGRGRWQALEAQHPRGAGGACPSNSGGPTIVSELYRCPAVGYGLHANHHKAQLAYGLKASAPYGCLPAANAKVHCFAAYDALV
jgi:hypothetical protein